MVFISGPFLTTTTGHHERTLTLRPAKPTLAAEGLGMMMRRRPQAVDGKRGAESPQYHQNELTFVTEIIPGKFTS
jgi:hypothetical protein